MTEDGPEVVRRVLTWLGISDVEVHMPQLSDYATWLAEEAVAAGGIGPDEPERIWRRHIADSLVFAIEPGPSETVLDLGSGAGLPGIPLAIAFPSWQVTLIDRSERRCDLMARALEVVGVANAEVVCADIGRGEQRAMRVVMRAVLDPLEAIPVVRRHLRPDGTGYVGISVRQHAALAGHVGRAADLAGTDFVAISPDVLDGGATLLRIAPRGNG